MLSRLGLKPKTITSDGYKGCERCGKEGRYLCMKPECEGYLKFYCMECGALPQLHSHPIRSA